VYFRRKGETSYRKLGVQETSVLPPKGSDGTVDVDGTLTLARVIRLALGQEAARLEPLPRWRLAKESLAR
jgi:hypothetical protein